MILAEIQNINILRQVHLEVSYLVNLMRPLGAQYGPQLTSNKRGKINEVYILSGPTYISLTSVSAKIRKVCARDAVA